MSSVGFREPSRDTMGHMLGSYLLGEYINYRLALLDYNYYVGFIPTLECGIELCKVTHKAK
jgi:hypothetical protein